MIHNIISFLDYEKPVVPVAASIKEGGGNSTLA